MCSPLDALCRLIFLLCSMHFWRLFTKWRVLVSARLKDIQRLQATPQLDTQQHLVILQRTLHKV
jgi:hypothetical protein